MKFTPRITDLMQKWTHKERDAQKDTQGSTRNHEKDFFCQKSRDRILPKIEFWKDDRNEGRKVFKIGSNLTGLNQINLPR